jgi:hypothetical protein
MYTPSISELSGLNVMNLLGGHDLPRQLIADSPVNDVFLRTTENELPPLLVASGPTSSLFGDSVAALTKQGATTMESSLDPVWQGWAQFVGTIYNLTSTQVAGAMIFGVAAGSIWGLYATHVEKSEVCFVHELEKLERDLSAPRIFDLVALRKSSIRNLAELKQALQAHKQATERLKLYQSEHADIHDWLAAPKGRGPSEGVITMRMAYGRIVRALETKIRSFFIHLLMTNGSDSPVDQKDRFIRNYGEFIRVTGYETSGDTRYPFRQELGWLMQRYEECRQGLSPE